MRRGLRIYNAFYFSFCKGRKKKYRLISYANANGTRWKNLTEIGSWLLLPIAFFFTSNVIFIVDVGYLRCLLFFFSCSRLVFVTRENNMKRYYVLLRWKWPLSKINWQVILTKYLKIRMELLISYIEIWIVRSALVL